MNVWLIEDGEKRGPYPAFEVEGRIRSGELGRELRGWIEGEREWRPLGELAAFAAVFHERGERDDEAWARWESGQGSLPVEAGKEPPPPVPPPVTGHGHWLRRFFARWFDLQMFSLLWWAGMWWAGRDLVGALTNPWLVLAQMAPWFLLEAFLLHRFGTTPGKFLLGLRVTAADDRPAGLMECLRRCVRVWALGLGLGLPVVGELCQAVSWWIGRRTGGTLWDRAGDFRVHTVTVQGARVAVFVVLFFVILQVRGWLLMPAMLEIYGEQFPWLREMLGK